MMDTDQITKALPEDASPADIARRWRRAQLYLLAAVLRKAERLSAANPADEDDARERRAKEAEEAADIRAVASLVIAAQRAMENEDRHAPKTAGTDDARAARSAELAALKAYENDGPQGKARASEGLCG